MKTENKPSGEKQTQFRTRPVVLFALLTLCVFFSAMILGVVSYWMQSPVSGLSMPVIGIVVAIAYWVSVATSALTPVILSSEGIRSFTAVGNYQTIRWEAISSVESVNAFGLRYARIQDASGKHAIWIPAWLNNRAKFLNEVASHCDLSEAIADAWVRGASMAGVEVDSMAVSNGTLAEQKA